MKNYLLTYSDYVAIVIGIKTHSMLNEVCIKPIHLFIWNTLESLQIPTWV